MTKEILAIPEEHLQEVIRVIQCGIRNVEKEKLQVSDVVLVNLINWCENESEYLQGLLEN